MDRSLLDAEFIRAATAERDGRAGEAEAIWREIVARHPTVAEACVNLAKLLERQDRFAEAEALLRQAHQLQPTSAASPSRLADHLHMVGKFAEAEGLYRQALQLDPAYRLAQLGLSHLLLAQARWTEGWPLYEVRKDLPNQGAPRLPIAGEWRGEPLAGRSLLIWPEQGFGDMIQFARFAPLLRDAGAKVTLGCPPELAPLFADLGVDLLPLQGEVTLQGVDLWTLLLSIPAALGESFTIPAHDRYIEIPEGYRRKWLFPERKQRAGIVWRGRPTHPNDRRRSLPSPHLIAGPLAALGYEVVDLQTPRGDFADAAAIVEQLDVVVTVDTAMAHLAGAVGVRCLVLLPWAKPDWRWGRDRSDSPWYPSLRLFRQPSAGDWATPIAEAVHHLQAEGSE